MTPMLFAAAVVAGGIGAGLRYVVDLVVQRVFDSRFPWGILTVNLTGALALGILSGATIGTSGLWVLGTGLLGGYTTFSSVAVTTVLLAEDRRTRASILYGVGTLVGSIVCAAGGLALGMVLA
jgi:fluoride exporter